MIKLYFFPIPIHWCHMSVMVSEINQNLTVCSTACPGQQQSNHQNSTLLALCMGNPPVTGGFPTQRAKNTQSVYMSWIHLLYYWPFAGIIFCMRPANERWRYIVTSSHIGCAHTQNDQCLWMSGHHHCLQTPHDNPPGKSIWHHHYLMNGTASWNMINLYFFPIPCPASIRSTGFLSDYQRPHFLWMLTLRGLWYFKSMALRKTTVTPAR